MGRIQLFPLLFQNGCSQSSRFLLQARRIVGSGDENGFTVFSIANTFVRTSKSQMNSNKWYKNQPFLGSNLETRFLEIEALGTALEVLKGLDVLELNVL